MDTKEISLQKIAAALQGNNPGKGLEEQHLVKIADSLESVAAEGKSIEDILKASGSNEIASVEEIDALFEGGGGEESSSSGSSDALE